MGRIVATQVGKFFRSYSRPLDRVADWLSFGRRSRFDERWVLRHVDFSVSSGESVGIIGSNGAGKSTLLKLLRGTLRPSEGQIVREGRLSALDLAMGFHGDFSGFQNLRIAGSMLGVSARELEERLPDIVEFSELGDRLEDAVRTYSSGMYLRLAFSLATCIRPSMLLVDEALAVGDAYFQQKCIARIRRFREEGTSLIIVSHDPGLIRSLCERVVLLENGVIVHEGPPDRVFEYYNAVVARRASDYSIREAESMGSSQKSLRSGNRHAEIESAEIRDAVGSSRSFQVGQVVTIVIEGRASRDLDDLTVGVSIRDRVGNEVFGTNTHYLGVELGEVRAGSSFVAEFELPLNLGCGHYTLTAALHAGSVHLEGSYDWWDRVSVFEIIPGTEAPFVGSAYLPVSSKMELS